MIRTTYDRIKSLYDETVIAPASFELADRPKTLTVEFQKKGTVALARSQEDSRQGLWTYAEIWGDTVAGEQLVVEAYYKRVDNQTANLQGVAKRLTKLRDANNQPISSLDELS